MTSSFAAGSERSSPKGIRLGVEQLDVRAAEHPVRAGIVDVPGELLGGDLNDERLALRGHAIDPGGPERDGEPEQQNRLHHGHADFGIGSTRAT